MASASGRSDAIKTLDKNSDKECYMKQLFIFPAMALALMFGSISAVIGEDLDLSGNWSMTVNGPTGPQTSEMSVTQNGEEISGTINGSQGPNAFTGNVAGTAVEFGFTMEA